MSIFFVGYMKEIVLKIIVVSSLNFSLSDCLKTGVFN